MSQSHHTQRSLFTSDSHAILADTWRPAIEYRAAFLWAGVSIIMAYIWLYAPNWAGTWLPVVSVLLVISQYRALKLGLAGHTILKQRSALAGRPSFVITLKRLSQYLSESRADTPDPVWFGQGFDWAPEHAQKLYELSKLDDQRLIPPRWMRVICGLQRGKNSASIGWGAIGGLSEKHEHLAVTEKTLEGGTLIVGTTQAGKGVLLSVLISQAILRGDTVIVIDPKMSGRLQKAVSSACAFANREAPHFLHPSEHAQVRLNPLAHFSSPAEIASRITSVMNEDGPFTAFAWSAVNTAVSLLTYCQTPPTLARIEQILQGGMSTWFITGLKQFWGTDGFTLRYQESLEKITKKAEKFTQDDKSYRSSNPREPNKQTPFFGKTQDATQVSAQEQRLVLQELIALLRADSDAPKALLQTAEVLSHNPEHYKKITASLMPILAMLTTGALRETLSPEFNPQDSRPILSLSSLIENNGVLYLCLNALPDPVVASAIGAILLADLASCAGARYNDQRLKRTRISLFVDECSNVINQPLIEILNKGAESGIRTTCAMQTVSDLAARLGNNDRARMALGNFNNLISLRTKDRVTQDFVAETFGQTYIAQTAKTISQSSQTGPVGLYRAQVSEQLSSQRLPLVPTEVLGMLPNCEFFAALAGGRLVKGQVPFLSF